MISGAIEFFGKILANITWLSVVSPIFSYILAIFILGIVVSLVKGGN